MSISIDTKENCPNSFMIKTQQAKDSGYLTQLDTEHLQKKTLQLTSYLCERRCSPPPLPGEKHSKGREQNVQRPRGKDAFEQEHRKKSERRTEAGSQGPYTP